jgi:hypothetical protein
MEDPMPAARTSVLIAATAAMFVMAAYASAEAGYLCNRMGGFQRAMGSYHKSSNFTPPARVSKEYAKPSYAKPKAAPQVAKVVPQKQHKVVQQKQQQNDTAAHPVKSAGVATATPPVVADATTSTPIATSSDTCLVKEYLDTGVVQFRDVCTKEWATNSINSDAKASKIRSACLTKQNNHGVVMFKDVCTGEWAMNTAKQMAVAKAQ